jgi:hypothetical protein
MNDEPVSAQAEGEALPESCEIKASIHIDAAPVIAAIERWYAAHFHAAALAGRAPITADDKAALIQHVADAVAPTATQE